MRHSRTFHRCLDELRSHKSERELAILRRAGELTARAINKRCNALATGLYEYQLAAIADYVFADAGRTCAQAIGRSSPAVPIFGTPITIATIVCCATGDLVLMDYAPDIGCYTSDIGRMWPVNGRYTPVQRELYGFVVAYHQVLFK